MGSGIPVKPIRVSTGDSSTLGGSGDYFPSSPSSGTYTHPRPIYRKWSGISRVEDKTHDGYSRSRHGKHVSGYPKLADHLGELRGNAIVRQFSALQARSLLYLHSDILELEEELHMLEASNATNSQGLLRSMHELKKASRADHTSAERKQFEVMAELRVKLKEYNQAVLEQARMNSLQKASTADVLALRQHIYTKHSSPGQEPHWWMDHVEGSAWQADDQDKAYEHDLVYLYHAHDHISEPFAMFLLKFIRHVAMLFPRLFARDGNADGDVYIPDRAIRTCTRVLSTAAASLLPSASIFALYYIQSLPWRLGFIMIWSVFFSSCLTIFSSASTAQIFEASAAMAAVQVVFVGIV